MSGAVGEMAFRFIAGGLIVALFSLGGDVFKPHSFGGLFGAAPSVAMATLAFTIGHEGSHHAAIEARSMCGGAIALCVYACAVSWLLRRRRMPLAPTLLLAFPSWLAAAGIFWLCLRLA